MAPVGSISLASGPRVLLLEAPAAVRDLISGRRIHRLRAVPDRQEVLLRRAQPFALGGAGRLSQVEEGRALELARRAANGGFMAQEEFWERARRLREQIAAIEGAENERFRAQVAQDKADAASLTINRDPERGMVKLEYFVESGQASPAAAFESLLAGIVNGRDDRVAGLVALPSDVKARLETLIASLSSQDQAEMSSPERLVALYLSNAMIDVPAAQIVSTEYQDGGTATLSVRGIAPQAEQVAMGRGAAGWQISVSGNLESRLESWVRGHGN